MNRAFAIISLLFFIWGTGFAQNKVTDVFVPDSLSTQSNLVDLLTGKIPGVHITATDGMPYSEPEIHIRGITGSAFLANTTYKVLIDDIPYDGPLSLINPHDIESITVIKEVADILRYDTNASGGILAIRMKQAAPKGFSVSASYSKGVVVKQGPDYQAAQLPQFLQYWWQARRNRYYLSGSSVIDGNLLSQYLVTDYLKVNPFDRPITQVLDPRDGSVNPDACLLWEDDLNWRKEIEQIGFRQDAQVSFGSGGKKAAIRGSAGVTDEDSYAAGIGSRRYSATLFSNVSPFRSFQITASFLGVASSGNGDQNIRTSQDRELNPFTFVRMIGNIYPIHQHLEDGQYVLKDGVKQLDFGHYTDTDGYIHQSRIQYETYNALESLEKWQRDHVRWEMGQGTLSARWEPLSGLKLAVTGNGQVSSRESFIVRGYESNYENDYRFNDRTLFIKENVDYDNKSGRHSFHIGIEHRNAYAYSTTLRQMTPVNYGTATQDTANLNTHIDGWSLNETYCYDGKYSISFNGAKRLIGGNQSYTSWSFIGMDNYEFPDRWSSFFYGGSLCWQINRERFCAGFPWLDRAQLRTSFGLMSNAGMGDLYEWNVGLDIGFSGRFRGSIVFFDRSIRDTMSFQMSYSPPAVSTYITRNQGLEIAMDAILVKNRNLSLSVNGNLSYTRSRITQIPDGSVKLGKIIYEINQSPADFWLPVWLGVDPSSGRSVYKAIPQDDPSYESYSVAGNYFMVDGEMCTTKASYAQKEHSGHSIPPVLGGFGMSFRYKALSISLSGYYQLGGKLYDQAYREMMILDNSVIHSLHSDLSRAWQKSGDRTDVPMLDTGNSANSSASSRWLISSDMVELTQGCIAYDISGWRRGIPDITLYLTANNCLMLSARRGVYPRMITYGGFTSLSGMTPARTVSLGAQINL